MRIIYLSKNMNFYDGAMYHRDLMSELAKKNDVIFYGPGFENFNPEESIETTIKKIGGADLLILGHAWLSDLPYDNVDPYPNLRLEDCSLKKIVILNKEYVNLESKLEWIRNKSFDFGFSHHHNVKYFQKVSGVNFTHWPFAFNHNLFKTNKVENKDIDFAFSGILINVNANYSQAYTRTRVMKKLFNCLSNIPLSKKNIYKDYKIFWNSIPPSYWQQKISIYLNKYKYLKDDEYIMLQKRSRVFLNTLSPGGLVGTRFYENMASRTLVFCQDSMNIKNMFPSNCYLTFKKDFEDFDEKFKLSISDSKERNNIVERAFELAATNHTWEIRVNQLFNSIKL